MSYKLVLSYLYDFLGIINLYFAKSCEDALAE